MHPHKPGGDLMEILADMDTQHQKEVLLFQDILQLLSLEKIGCTGSAAPCLTPLRMMLPLSFHHSHETSSLAGRLLYLVSSSL